MASLADLEVKIGTDITDLDKGLRSSSEKVAEFGKGMQTAGLKMTAFATAPIIAGFAKAADAAGDLGESVNAVNVVFGKGADKIHEFGKVSAKEAGLSARAFNELVTPVGAALQNVGFGADEAADASINLAKRAADMASVFNVDVSEALSAIQSGLRGEADPLERFGVGLSDAAVTAHALELGLAGTAAELDDNAKTQARLSLLMEQTDRVAGDFANTLADPANASRKLAADTENAAAAFGERLLPMKAKAIELAGSLLDKFSNMSPAMQTAATAALGVAAAIGPLLVVGGTLVRSMGEIGKATSTVIGWFTKKSAAATTSAATEVAANNATKTSMLSTVAAKTRAMASWVASQVAAMARAVAAGAAWAAQTVAQGAKAVASMAVTTGQFIAHYARLAAASMINAAKMAASWVVAMGPVGWVIAGVVALVALVIANWEKVSAFTKRAWTALTGFITGAVTAIRDRVVSTFTGLRDKVVATIQALMDRIRSIKDAVVGFFSGAGQWLVNAGRNIVMGLVNGIKRNIGKAVDAVRGGVQKIRNLLPFSPAKDGPLSGRGAPDIAGSKIGQMLADGMRSQIRTVARAGDALAGAAVHEPGGINVPSVRRLGGANTNGRGGAGGGTTIQLVLDRRVISQVVRDDLIQVGRRNGDALGGLA